MWADTEAVNHCLVCKDIYVIDGNPSMVSAMRICNLRGTNKIPFEAMIIIVWRMVWFYNLNLSGL